MADVLTQSLAAVAIGALAVLGIRRAHDRRQLRYRLFELMAASMRRAVPFAPPIRRLAGTLRDASHLEDLAERLESGEALSACLRQSLPRGIVQEREIRLVAATEGTPALQETLDRIADGSRRDNVSRRAAASLSYPALLAIMLIVVQWTSERIALTTTGSPWLSWVGTALAGAFLAVIALMHLAGEEGRLNAWVGRVTRYVPFIREVRQMFASAHTLRLASGLTAVGMPMARVLDRVGSATSHLDLRRGTRDAAELAATGANVETVWRTTGIPEFAVALAATRRGSSHDLSERLRIASSVCARRAEAGTSRLLAVAQPGLILLFGLLLGVHFAEMFQTLTSPTAAGGTPW